MLLGRKEPPGEDAYHFGKINGADKKFCRLVAGVILPMSDRQQGCVVVIGELFRSFAQPDFTGLAAAVGEYNAIERALLEFDRDLQFRDAIMEDDSLRPLLWKIPGLSLKILTAVAPKYSFTEIGRKKVDRMIEEGKLHLDLIEDTLRQGEQEVITKAVHAAVCWMQEYPHLYRNTKKKAQPEYQKIWGTTGL
jgi:hypothetical protein